MYRVGVSDMRKAVITTLLLVPVMIAVSLVYLLTSQDIESLLVCSTSQSTRPWAKTVCQYYLFHYRGTKKDIAELEKGAGLSFVLDDDREYANFLIQKGIDINKVSPTTGATPLLTAVVENDPTLVKYLLEKGADINVKGYDKLLPHAMTPLELVEYLASKNPQVDRSEIKNLLETSKHLNRG